VVNPGGQEIALRVIEVLIVAVLLMPACHSYMLPRGQVIAGLLNIEEPVGRRLVKRSLLWEGGEIGRIEGRYDKLTLLIFWKAFLTESCLGRILRLVAGDVGAQAQNLVVVEEPALSSCEGLLVGHRLVQDHGENALATLM